MQQDYKTVQRFGMIEAEWTEEIVVALASPLLMVVAQLTHSTYKKLYSYATTQCIVQISNIIMAKVEPDDEELHSIRRRFTKKVLLDAVLFISEHIYGTATNRIALIVEVCGLDYYILNQIEGKRDTERANLLAKLSRLAPLTVTVEYAEIYIEDGNRDSRFYSMVALVATRPERAVQYITRFNSPLTLHETAILANLIHRIGAPIAYTPLLTSQNRNLQLLGIYISNLFAIADAEPHLQQLIESDEREIAYIALLTLCSVRGDISSQNTGYALRRLLQFQRTTFIRHAVLECYSLHSCAQLLSTEEQTLFSQRLSSYKCRILCN